ncbi:MAG: ABC transporter permease [Polyangiaceae bacterium]|jgi:putative ABC transport system permease protein
MFRISLQSLLHERGKLVASLAGVTFATVLVLSQLGMYAGFLQTSSDIIVRMGGDVWVMARGTRVFDFAEPLSSGARSIAASHPCVRRIRSVVSGFAQLRTASGAHIGVEVIGFEPSDGVVFPWTFARGLPSDLRGAARVSVDALDLGRLEIPPPTLGVEVDIGEHRAWVAAETGGIRGFTLSPYIFANLDVARRLTGLSDGQAHYLVIDLADRSCSEDLRATIERQGDLQVMDTRAFAHMTEAYWVDGAGAGAALALGAILGLVVGVVIVGQTLFSVVNDHRRELATLKAVGASGVEIVSFVVWQALALAVVGGALGLAGAELLASGAQGVGLTVALTPATIAKSLGAVAVMCGLASLWSGRAVLRLEAAEVFR